MDTKIDSVVVYRDRAEIKRLGTSKFETQGQHVVVVAGLPVSLLDSSVRIKTIGVNNAIKLVETKPEILAPKDQSQIAKDFYTQLETLKKNLENLLRDRMLEQKKSRLLRQFVHTMQGTTDAHCPMPCIPPPFRSSVVSPGCPPVSFATDADFLSNLLRESDVENSAHQRKLSCERSKLLDELTLLKEKMNQHGFNLVPIFPNVVAKESPKESPIEFGEDSLLKEIQDIRLALNQTLYPPRNLRGNRRPVPPVATKKQVEISLEILEVGTLAFEITYSVAGASWKPQYDFKRETNGPNIFVKYGAHISQSTGDEWVDVKVKLSTSSALATGGTPPALPVVDLSLEKPTEQDKQKEKRKRAMGAGNGRMMSRAMPEMMDAPPMMMAMAMAAPPPEMTVKQAVVEEGVSGSVTFAVEKRVTVPSNNQSVRVTVAGFNLAATFVSLTVPQIAPFCYSFAVIENTSNFLLLPSQDCSIFVDGAYVSKSKVGSANPGETFTTYMGVDSDVKVSETQPRKVGRQTGFISKANVSLYNHLAVIKNNSAVEKRLGVVRSVPKSTDEKIKVTLMKPLPENITEVSLSSNEELIAKFLADFTLKEKYWMNKTTDCVVMLKKLANNSELEFPLEYEVEAPAGKIVTIS